MFPTRFTVCTYNVWTWTRWPERRDALQGFARTVSPDLLCLQEVQPESLAAVDESLGSTHDRVDDHFDGWRQEGMVYWRRDQFEEIEHGAVDVRPHSAGAGNGRGARPARPHWSGSAVKSPTRAAGTTPRWLAEARRNPLVDEGGRPAGVGKRRSNRLTTNCQSAELFRAP